jgi:hypothetical protein
MTRKLLTALLLVALLLLHKRPPTFYEPMPMRLTSVTAFKLLGAE